MPRLRITRNCPSRDNLGVQTPRLASGNLSGLGRLQQALLSIETYSAGVSRCNGNGSPRETCSTLRLARDLVHDRSRILLLALRFESRAVGGPTASTGAYRTRGRGHPCDCPRGRLATAPTCAGRASVGIAASARTRHGGAAPIGPGRRTGRTRKCRARSRGRHRDCHHERRPDLGTATFPAAASSEGT